MNKLRWNSNQNEKNLFIRENTSENIICDMAAILSRGRWVEFYNITDAILFRKCPIMIPTLPWLNRIDIHTWYEKSPDR